MVCEFVVSMFFITQLQNHSLILPFTMVMYGMGIFISGGVINYRPLIMGGIISWIAALVAWFQPYNVQLLVNDGNSNCFLCNSRSYVTYRS